MKYTQGKALKSIKTRSRLQNSFINNKLQKIEMCKSKKEIFASHFHENKEKLISSQIHKNKMSQVTNLLERRLNHFYQFRLHVKIR